MKNRILIIYVVMLAILTACGQQDHEHHEATVVPATADTGNISAEVNVNPVMSIKEIIAKYLDLKNALVNDNTKEAAASGTALETEFKTLDKTSLGADQKKVYEDVEDDAREHAEHIGANGGNIEHQREHFVMLSKDMYDLIKAFGSPQPLFQFFCPMANDGKGAIWLSEFKEVKNPYFGKTMMTCGSMKEEFK